MNHSVYKNGQICTNSWTIFARNEVDFEQGDHLFDFGDFLALAEQGALPSSAQVRLAVKVNVGDEVEKLGPWLEKLSMIAVDFPAFSDGRGFSSARLLREQLGYKGEIRATGHYILDQISLMQRCGIDSFLLENPHLQAALEKGHLNEVRLYTQPAIGSESKAQNARPWLRKAN
ncbi:DUF934 domain-containing protein [Polycladidibacter stylochi]|uniref:DUF934 domain-containing protein n=1 Tax=Polycladidibacter stylochi TaxID=1807766 RepID=UPI00082E5DBF|nr:DUF934 domain-containing protein [Pseudovibrio stylochi]